MSHQSTQKAYGQYRTFNEEAFLKRKTVRFVKDVELILANMIQL